MNTFVKAGIGFVGAVLLGVATEANALEFQLNCLIGNGTCTDSVNFGTITITDITGGVQVTIDTTSWDSDSRIQKVALNTTTAVTSATGATVTYDSNEINIGPYCQPDGCFDLRAPATGNLGWAPVTFSLFGTGLDAADFNVKDSAYNLLYAGVHIGACGDVAPCIGPGSLFVGAKDAPTSVPEPSSLLLLGAGLAGLGIWRRKLA